eukprot:scaffold10862_cov106-Skeletonema_dohrnii-CCMP3373.AAC.8
MLVFLAWCPRLPRSTLDADSCSYSLPYYSIKDLDQGTKRKIYALAVWMSAALIRIGIFDYF